MVTVRSGNIDFFGSVKRMITGQDALMWLAVTAAVGIKPTCEKQDG